MPIDYHKTDVKVGSATNTQLQFTQTISDYTTLALFYDVVEGTVFVSQNATIEASLDNITWFTIETKSLGNGTTASSFYNENTSTINPLAFPYMRVTIPALGLAQTARVRISGKIKNFTRQTLDV